MTVSNRRGSQVLVSCFDADLTVGGGLFAFDGAEITALDRLSTTGLHFDGTRLLRCIWSDPGSAAELLVYDRVGLLRYARVSGVTNPHDVHWDGDEAVVVATGENRVVWVSATGAVTRTWQPSGEPDSWHLNGLVERGGRLFVCAFGRFNRRKGWDAAGRPPTGCIVDLASGDIVADGLLAPHNPTFVGGELLICNSLAGELVLLDTAGTVRRRAHVGGWPRGLAVAEDRIYLGLSPARHHAESSDTAKLAILDRTSWDLLEVIDLPGREAYAILVVPALLVEGLARATATNHTRGGEQAQRRLFEELGVQPERLWAIADPLPRSACRIEIRPAEPLPTIVESDTLLQTTWTVRNAGNAILPAAPPHPVLVIYRWLDEKGRVEPCEPMATRLSRSLPPGEELTVPLHVRVPMRDGDLRLRVTAEQHRVCRFDEIDARNAFEANVAVRARAVGAGLGDLAVDPSIVTAAKERHRTGGTAKDVVATPRAAAARQPDDIVAAPVGARGHEAFGSQIHTATGFDAAEPALAPTGHLDGKDREMLLTGAEAVALLLAAAGARTAFAYGGTSELALCDAIARLLHVELVNARGDAEAAFMAGGASLFEPLRGVAVLHGARGLTNATGALADLRRNEIATLAVVGMCSVSSARFLPPHGETDLISRIGAFTKWWHEAGVVPEDDERAAAAFVGAFRTAVNHARTRPYGPVLFGLPQDVAERRWIPVGLVTARDEPPTDLRAAAESDLAGAAAALREARRPLLLIDDYLLRYHGAADALAQAADRLGAPVLQVRYRRGAMLFERLSATRVPAFHGWFRPDNPGHRELLAATDLLVTLEDRNMYPRVVGELPPCRKLAITSDAAKARKNEYLSDGDLLVEGDVVVLLRDLTARIAGADGHPRAASPWAPRPADETAPPPVLPAKIARLRAGLVAGIGAAMSAAERPVLVDDSQMFGGLIAEYYDLLPERTRVVGGHGGFVGGGLAQATGLAIADAGVRVFCALGDQAATNAMQGAVVAAQEGARVVYLLCNNGGSVSLLKQSLGSDPQWLDGGRDRYLANPLTLDHRALFASMGVDAWTVDLRGVDDDDAVDAGLEQLEDRLAQALNASGPALVELRMPGLGPAWEGVWIIEGFEQRPTTAPSPALEGAR